MCSNKMRGSLFHEQTLLPMIIVLLAIYVDATLFPMRSCRYSVYDHQHCDPRLPYQFGTCFDGYNSCDLSHGLSDCLIPGFFCFANLRCIPRRHVCNGIPDCSDDSDEWGCFSDIFSSASESTSTMHPDSTEYTSSYNEGASTILQDNEENKTTDVNNFSTSTTSRIVSSSITINTMDPYSKSIDAFSSSLTTLSHSETTTDFSPSATKTNGPYSGLNNIFSSSPPTKSITFPKSESNPSSATSTTSTMFSASEPKTVLSSSTITNTMLPGSESDTSFTPPTKSALLTKSSSNIDFSFSTTTKMTVPTSETANQTVVENTTPVAVTSVEISSLTKNALLSKSRAIQSCPENYCMQNAECIVVQGQYRCKCPSSFIGDRCEIRLGTELGSHEYIVIIAVTLVILCLAVISVCTYRYKRTHSWKFRDGTTRTLSQLTLASHAVE